MTDMAFGCTGKKLPQVGEDPVGWNHKIGETCVPGAHYAPQQTEHYQQSDRISGMTMHGQSVALEEVGKEEEEGERPVKQSKQRIPYHRTEQFCWSRSLPQGIRRP